MRRSNREKDGIIQRLNNSPAAGLRILSTAAQEAVKQWRFRPYLTIRRSCRN